MKRSDRSRWMWRLGAGLTALALTWGARDASAARIKDIAVIQGIQSAQLVGYGIVTGLNGTGDIPSSVPYTERAIENMLLNLGLTLQDARAQIRSRNVASVIVTADMPPFMRAGGKFDVIVSAFGDARSLVGGTLVMTNLQNAEGIVIAQAQGSVATGGFRADAPGALIQKGHVTAGRIPNGGVVLVEAPAAALTTPDPTAADPATAQPQMILGLQNPDFTTASRVAAAINAATAPGTALATDPASIRVTIPAGNAADLVTFIAQVENLDVTPDQRARVMIDEKTGTVIITENVRISPIGVSYGNLTVNITTTQRVSQPNPFGQGTTVVVPESDITVQEAVPGLNEGGVVQIIPNGATLNELVQALNALGVSPRDLISILQAIKEAGALQAELEIM